MCTNILAHGEIQLHVCGIFAATELFWRKIAILVSIELCLHRIAWQLAKQVGGAVTLTRARYEYPQVHMFVLLVGLVLCILCKRAPNMKDSEHLNQSKVTPSENQGSTPNTEDDTINNPLYAKHEDEYTYPT